MGVHCICLIRPGRSTNPRPTALKASTLKASALKASALLIELTFRSKKMCAVSYLQTRNPSTKCIHETTLFTQFT